MRKIIILIVVLMLVAAGIIIVINRDTQETKSDKEKLIVSILPIKHILKEIVGEDYIIEVIVPPGSSPETYEPTPQQLISISECDLIFTTGLIDFENELISKSAKDQYHKVVNLSKDIELLSGCCNRAAHGHNHGIDPHIWTSPRQLRIMAKNIYDALGAILPEDHAVKYQENYYRLLNQIDSLDAAISSMLIETNTKYFFIYHPALTYYADDYGIDQISIENEGKEPSAEQLRQLIDLARSENISKILYQREFSRSTVEIIAKDIGAEAIEIDPLAENILESIMNITIHITQPI